MQSSQSVSIVTGASSGIGEATALSLAKAGHAVIIAARRADRLKSLRSRIEAAGGVAIDVACDVTLRTDVQGMIDAAMKRFGRVDVLVNNAGLMANAPIAKCRVDDWDAMIDINLKGLLYGVAAALPVMLKQKTGHIINVSSIAGRKLFPGAAVYCGTKHAVHAISEGLRSELAELGDGNRVRVTIIAPGVVITELPDNVRDQETREAYQKYYGGLEGPLTSQDIADAILFAVRSPPHVAVNEILVRPTSQVR